MSNIDVKAHGETPCKETSARDGNPPICGTDTAPVSAATEECSASSTFWDSLWETGPWTGYAATALSRVMFYPSLAWNIARTTVQPDYRWYTEIVENLLLGALPFHSMLDDFKQQGIQAVVTLNEGFELFVTTEHYEALGIQHLHIPTIDFLFAPNVEDMHRAVDFIQGNLSGGRRTYVHCKAGRGRSATVVVCFLVKHRGMAPEEALLFVRERRPQICLAPGQWAAVLEFRNSCAGPAAASG
mmetsp:Transcript_27859/g.66176  ORF Transcript_27859/g.66176 Transcript_27859/m.66176 type:complete len:243 (-) Transcript_27859:229-957(-)